MSPQPAAAPAAPAETSAQKQLRRAMQLEKQRGDLMKQIASNREFLRLMAENEELDDDQTDFLDDFYPQKEKGQVRSDDEIERTRRAKAAARAGATTVQANREAAAKMGKKATEGVDDDE